MAALREKLAPLRSGKGESSPNLDAIGSALTALASDVEGTDRAPTEPQRKLLDESRSRIDRALALLQLLRKSVPLR